MNNWKIFTEGLPNFDNDGFSKVGIPLDKFLNETKRSELDNYRVLYLIRTVAEKNIIKFGISDGAGYYRLNGYVISYGRRGKNKCNGVDLLFLGGVKKKEDVPWTIEKSKIKRMEAILKESLPLVMNRGEERTTASVERIKKVMTNRGKSEEDIAIELKRSQRNKEEGFYVGERVKYVWDKEAVEKDGGEKFLGKTLVAKIEKVNQTTVDIRFVADKHVMRVLKSKVIR